MGVDGEVPRYRAHIQHGGAPFSPVLDFGEGEMIGALDELYAGIP